MPNREGLGLRLERLEQDAKQAYPFLVSDEELLSMRDLPLSSPSTTSSTAAPAPPPKWVHFVAGGLGGMMGAVLTCPLDVVKTRLQSETYHKLYNKMPKSSNPLVMLAQHFAETFLTIRSLYTVEGYRSLFKGLGPNLVGVIPARSINFFTYGASKDFILQSFFHGQSDATAVHLLLGMSAGFVTLTATNPIWLVKTRLQLDRSKGLVYRNSWDCLRSVVKKEGVLSLYRGLSALYLGGVESTLQWVLYEQMKLVISRRSVSSGSDDGVRGWAARLGAAGAAKFIASLITYPHEVIRTRLRQAPVESTGKAKYTGLVQCFRLVVKEEGLASMYGGLTPHLLRTVPNSIIMFGTWELVVKLLS